jgi:hypothetical protein
MKNKFRLLIVLGITIMLCLIPISVLALTPSDNVQYNSLLEEWTNKLKPSNVGKEIKNIKYNNKKIIAYINGEAIYQNELDFTKYLDKMTYYHDRLNDNNSIENNYNQKSDDEFLSDIAKKKLIYKEAEKLGIAVTKEKAIEKLRESNKKIEQFVSAGNENYKQKQKESEEFIASMGMSWDEYVEEIGGELEMNAETELAYFSYFYKEEQKKKQIDSNYIVKDIYQYLNELLDNANFVKVNN